jgi:Mlc titration factor MtfA (ptsG expression regulator)
MTGSTEAQTPPSGTPSGQADGTGPFAAWERRARMWALAFAALALAVSVLIALAVIRSGQPAAMTLVLALAPAAGVYLWQTRKIRRRQAILREPFPPEWEAVLQRDVLFFRVLEPDAQQRFRRHVQVFLGEKRITGIQTRVDAATRVLVAASATIPIFGFPDWEWDQINEVLVYPTRFDGDFEFGDKQGHNILGMVGTGSLNRLMILSKPDLINGFRNPTDKRNVSIHEFAHLVDKTDGAVDGVPGVGLKRGAIGPWVDLVRRKMAEIEAGKSDINRYALTNEAEFFAVTSEYFFERPGIMHRKHPVLYAALERVFNQDLRARAGALRRELARGRPTFGRNSPCPCGSGRKFKKCCQAKVSAS